MESHEIADEADGLWWTVPKEKTKNSWRSKAGDLRVPLVGRAEAVVRRRKDQAVNGFLFPTSTGEMMKQTVISHGIYYHQPYCKQAPNHNRPRLCAEPWLWARRSVVPRLLRIRVHADGRRTVGIGGPEGSKETRGTGRRVRRRVDLARAGSDPATHEGTANPQEEHCLRCRGVERSAQFRFVGCPCCLPRWERGVDSAFEGAGNVEVAAPTNVVSKPIAFRRQAPPTRSLPANRAHFGYRPVTRIWCSLPFS